MVETTAPWDRLDGEIRWGEGPGSVDANGDWVSFGLAGFVVPSARSLDRRSADADLGEDDDSLAWDDVPVGEEDDEQNSVASSSEPAGGEENDGDDDAESGSSGELLVTVSRRLNSAGRSLSSPARRTGGDLVTARAKKPSRRSSRTPARVKGDEFVYPCWGCVRSAMSGSRSKQEFCNANAAETRSRRCYQCNTHSCKPLHPALREVARDYLIHRSDGDTKVRLFHALVPLV